MVENFKWEGFEEIRLSMDRQVTGFYYSSTFDIRAPIIKAGNKDKFEYIRCAFRSLALEHSLFANDLLLFGKRVETTEDAYVEEDSEIEPSWLYHRDQRRQTQTSP